MTANEEYGLVERYRLNTENVQSVLQLHVNGCQICRISHRKCDEGQYFVKLLAIVQANRWNFIFKPLDVS